ncbi:CoA pyrophosphatase [Stieleria sp. TO1_6]|nr:CoA pyrophosphatase [Stieleria tagensis]
MAAKTLAANSASLERSVGLSLGDAGSGRSEPGLSLQQLGRAVKPVLSKRQVRRGQRSGQQRPVRLSPRLAYGRHRGPARLDARRAAVIVVIYPHRRSGQLCLTLTRRPSSLSHHGGQVCLPGGKIEAGETALQAALREYREELGVDVAVVEQLGCLPPIYVFASDNLVDTWVVTADTPCGDWQPDPVEVDEVIEMPLESLLQLAAPGERLASRKKMRTGKSQADGEVFQYGFRHRSLEFVDCDGRPKELWGATAMLLDDLAHVLRAALLRD